MPQTIPPRLRLEVNLDTLAENAKTLCDMAGGREVMAAIKADAYCHGAVMVARELTMNGICRFAVATLSEAENLRCHRVPGELLILGYTDPVFAVNLITKDISQTIVSMEHARALSAAAVAAKGVISVHIKIDTGMSRVGLDCQNPDILDALREVCSLPGLKVTGCYTHFASADLYDEASDAFTQQQLDRFNEIIGAARAEGLDLGLLHACNSSATLRRPDGYFDMIRPGSLIEGLDPMPTDYHTDMPVKPIAELKTIVAVVKELPAGRGISYGQTYHTPDTRIIATIPIGYADGFDRGLSDGASVLIRGQYAPVVGTICMDQTMVDVTHIPGVQAGDTVTIIGRDGDKTIRVNDLADIIGQIYLDVMARLGRRVPIYYLRAGKVVAVLDYMAGGLKICGLEA